MPRPYAGVPPSAPFNPIPPNQFYSNDNPSPMRMAPMGGMGMMDHSHGMGGPSMSGMPGMGMSMGMGMGGGGMPTMSMNLSPSVSGRVNRGMVDEGFPMH